MQYQRVLVCALFAVAILTPGAFPDSRVDLGGASLLIDSRGYVRLAFGTEGSIWPTSVHPLLRLTGPGRILEPEMVALDGDVLSASFPEGAHCEMRVSPGDGFAVFEVTQFSAPPDINRIVLCSLALPGEAEVLDTLNAGMTLTHAAGLSAAEVNVHAFSESAGRSDTDREGCKHRFEAIADAKVGAGAARFTATCDAVAPGWSFCGRNLPQPIDLTGLKAIRAWVRGDAQGEQLKIQLYDGSGGYRDTYIPISFEGWQQITTTDNPLNTLRAEHVAALNIYYNGMPASTTVSCDIDQIEAIVERDGKEEAVLLEPFEADAPYWTTPTQTLNLETVAQHGLLPARFGVLAAPRASFFDAMERFERAAGIPSPHPDGIWNKRSPLTTHSYLFITSFSEPQTEEVIAMGKRGGFDTILILQDSWTHSTGHFEVNDKTFPGGLETLQHCVKRFKDAGFRVGFHFLGPSIYLNDSYVTPVPDARLVKWASANLTGNIDAQSTTLPVAAAPGAFPAEDGGYMGDGAILQVGDELIAYGGRTLEAPFGFTQCQRGALGTTAAAHAAGDVVRHVKRSYGYFLFDMDTTLIDEVTTNFARVANACGIDMIYFDGSENLQGDHWYYNARLHKAFYDKLDRKDILMQASSFSHYSWHLLARTASADGHDDLKLYLDERSGVFDAYRNEGMPLDIGWYYGYDPRSTPDMFEYVLGATIGYNSSMSFQVSLEAAHQHPFIGEILDLIGRYERLRLSGRVPQEMRDRLRIDRALAGVKPAQERAALVEARREYRLLSQDGHEVFQRVEYTPWHEVSATSTGSDAWNVNVHEGPAAVGVQMQVLAGPWESAGPSYTSPSAVTLESFDDLTAYASQSTLQGVSQHFSVSDDARAGGQSAELTAESTLGTDTGWSVVTKVLDPPLDLSRHKALAFWLRGDGKGGAFKVQLTDGQRAADFYIANDYSGWRYQQLPRPAADPIDYAQVRTLSFYYNGLPGKSVVTCSIDDLKALDNVDTPGIIDPWIEVGGQKMSWKGVLGQGQYLFLLLGEPWRQYGLPLTAPESDGTIPDTLIVAGGEQSVRFGCTGTLPSIVRVRVALHPPEQYPIP